METDGFRPDAYGSGGGMRRRMDARWLAEKHTVDGIPAQKLLEGLARLYQLVMVLDDDGHVVWLSNEMGALCAASDTLHVGDDATGLFFHGLFFENTKNG